MSIIKPTDNGLITGTIGNQGTRHAFKVGSVSSNLRAVTENIQGDGDIGPQHVSGFVYGQVQVSGWIRKEGAGLAIATIGCHGDNAQDEPPGAVNILGGPAGNLWIERIAISARRTSPLVEFQLSGRFHGLPTAGTGASASALAGLENPSCGVLTAVGFGNNFKVQELSAQVWTELAENSGDGDTGPKYQNGNVNARVQVGGSATGAIVIPGGTQSGVTFTIGTTTLTGDFVLENAPHQADKRRPTIRQSLSGVLNGLLTGNGAVVPAP